nr:retrotransposon protein, putative, unclassified [Tanacetum cinerariifolium]
MLYKMALKVAKLACLAASLVDDAWTWHARLGHANFYTLEMMGKKRMVARMPCVAHPKQLCTKGSGRVEQSLSNSSGSMQINEIVPFDTFDDTLVRGTHLLKDIYQWVPRMTEEEETQWMKAMRAEIDSIEKNQTWTLTRLPPIQKVIGLKWVFKLKRDASDVKSAFLNGELNEEVYVTQPTDFEVKLKEEMVYKLHKALYELRQAPRSWNAKIDKVLKELGFKRCAQEQDAYKLQRKSTKGSGRVEQSLSNSSGSMQINEIVPFDTFDDTLVRGTHLLKDIYQWVPRMTEEEETQWMKAMRVEIDSIEKNRTWTLTRLPPIQKVIGLKWVFKLKKDASGGYLDQGATSVKFTEMRRLIGTEDVNIKGRM